MSFEPLHLPHAETDWAPQSCTLPTAERPLRIAEFDDLFRTALRELDRLAPSRLRLRLDAACEARARDLTERETGCCSFFEFDYTSVDGGFLLDVTVPVAHVDVLNALAARAAAAAGLAA